jgi:hypothetical protein
MPIINRGVFDIDSVYLREVGNDWPTAQVITTSDVIEGTNQYFTNARTISALQGANLSLNNLIITGDLEVQGNTVTLNTATLTIEDKNIVLANGAVNAAAADGAGITISGANAIISYSNTSDAFILNKTLNVVVGDVIASGNLVANGLIIRNIAVSDSVLAGNSSATNVLADTVTANIWNRLYTSNVIENTNLYFTNTRARSAFTAGKGIVLQQDGTIINSGSSPQYNLDINGTSGGNVLSTMATMLTFPSVPSTDRFLLRSIHVVNLTESTTLISGNILYASGNTAFIANKIPVAEGGVLEFIKKGQLFQPGDKINLQGFDAAGTPTANIMTAIFTYETFSNDQSFVGRGQTLNTSNTNIQVYDSNQSFSIIESIKLVNLENYVVKPKVYWADANGLPIAYFAHNIPLPPNSSLELLQTPKRIEFTEKVYASYASNSQISVFVSARLGAVYNIGTYTANITPGLGLTTEFTTTDDEGTILYYTIE